MHHDALEPLPQDSLAGLRQAMAELVSGNAARWRAFWRGDAATHADAGEQEEQELPDWLGELLEGAVEASNGLLIKGAGHKYLRRVPKAGGGYRYFYNVTGGQGLGHASEMVQGAAFKVKHAGKEGHFHITADHGEEVTVKHDESGHEARMSKAALRAMLHAEHAEALGAVKVRAAKTLEQAQKTGTAKQQEKAAALVRKYGGIAAGLDARLAEKLVRDPIKTLQQLGERAVGLPLELDANTNGDWQRAKGPSPYKKMKALIIGADRHGVQIIRMVQPKTKNLADHKQAHAEVDLILWENFGKYPSGGHTGSIYHVKGVKLAGESPSSFFEGVSADQAVSALSDLVAHGDSAVIREFVGPHTNSISDSAIRSALNDFIVNNRANLSPNTHPALFPIVGERLEKQSVPLFMKLIDGLQYAIRRGENIGDGSLEVRAENILGVAPPVNHR